MRVGVKYCGGCNPRYDRVAFVERFRRRHPEATVEPAVTGVVYDCLLVVCGCSAQCADLTGFTGQVIHYIYQEDASF